MQNFITNISKNIVDTEQFKKYIKEYIQSKVILGYSNVLSDIFLLSL